MTMNKKNSGASQVEQNNITSTVRIQSFLRNETGDVYSMTDRSEERGQQRRDIDITNNFDPTEEENSGTKSSYKRHYDLTSDHGRESYPNDNFNN